ncbi:hypothetical protein D9758_010895 [Tetrapyrgos nigripes]|uniref:Uncharacterized protein n=1 Tax=Tetrapyrgos nigripes TaxID=182062 RepID=A0A8H5CW16_9AGAR|nr:hypothetical protein D9758_010895 [Tetrapyrgos nigripes]
MAFSLIEILCLSHFHPSFHFAFKLQLALPHKLEEKFSGISFISTQLATNLEHDRRSEWYDLSALPTVSVMLKSSESGRGGDEGNGGTVSEDSSGPVSVSVVYVPVPALHITGAPTNGSRVPNEDDGYKCMLTTISPRI